MKNFKAETLQKNIIASLQKRIDGADNDNMRDTLRDEIKQFEKKAALHALETLQALEVNMSGLFAAIGQTDKKNENFIAVYALQKIRKAAFALSQNSVAAFDKYTNSIVRNLATLQALDTLNTQRSICSKIELDEMQQAQAVKVYHNCSPSTASTQASSTRMMLKFLNICNVRKGAKGDSISFTDSASAKAIQQMYA